MQEAAEPLKVVTQGQKRAAGDERQQSQTTDKPSVDRRPEDRNGADGRKGPAGDTGTQRAAVQFVERMGTDAEAEKEAEQTPAEAVEANRVCQRRAHCDVRQIPSRVGRV